MDYKSLFRSQQLRFSILRLLQWVPDSIMLRVQYRMKMGFWPDFKHPKRFTEKLQLYKMKYRNSVMHQCVDKYEVRKYVESKGLGYILNDLYGVYDNPNEINFDELPNQFVMKTTTGGGGQNVVIVNDKLSCHVDEIKKQLFLWVSSNNIGALAGREWAYQNCKPRIIVEKLLEDQSVPSLIDYKFFCFNGEPVCCQVITGRWDIECIDFYDEKWNHQSYVGFNTYAGPEFGNSPMKLQKPSNYEEMWFIAGKLAADFPFVRVDLYSIQGKTIFGELTFYPASGYGYFTPDITDFEMGSFFTEY